ncbi:DnaB-like helicase C-terminal domain-containing protein [Solidesulfovibrio magneticus]|uniref:SF4 helicase domain-containing protein n=1 Tax=Solidesulfovibrio magneticus (strain ATCC 700980 / DSM 13731 / RS-1) TaxID=573370 RepID=C4XUN4_SOLM1|nr:DnaB-like helicase C-terminal domain-containing protein [Solidesulfovibrio magneticus]BAH73485.1 hypothetical protein DMR_p2_00040 [Solidesulfovibrio magneticus RS-1]
MKSQLSDALSGVLDKIKCNPSLSDNKTGLSTGIEVLDVYFRGITPGEVTVISGQRRHQFSLILNIILNIGLNTDTSIYYFSLGLTKENFALKLLCCHTDVSMQKPYTGMCSNLELEALTKSARTIETSGIKLQATDELAIQNLRDTIIDIDKNDKKTKFIVVDFMQNINFNRDFSTEHLFMVHSIETIKDIAKDTNMPIVALYYEYEKEMSGQSQISGDDLVNLMHTDLDALILVNDTMSSGSSEDQDSDDPYLKIFFADKYGMRADFIIQYSPHSLKTVNKPSIEAPKLYEPG